MALVSPLCDLGLGSMAQYMIEAHLRRGLSKRQKGSVPLGEGMDDEVGGTWTLALTALSGLCLRIGTV